MSKENKLARPAPRKKPKTVLDKGAKVSMERRRAARGRTTSTSR